MSIDLNGLSAKELDTLIANAKKRRTTLSKRKPIAEVRRKLTALARAEGYSVAELFGGGGAAAPAKKGASPRPVRKSTRATSSARSRRSTAIRRTRRKPGPAVASSRSGWPRRSRRAGSSTTS